MLKRRGRLGSLAPDSIAASRSTAATPRASLMPSLATASLCENPAVLRAQLRISGFTFGMETFWHAKGGWREFFLEHPPPTYQALWHPGYAATREAAMAAFAKSWRRK